MMKIKFLYTTLFFCLIGQFSFAQETKTPFFTRYQPKEETKKYRITPDHGKVHFAGSMGIISTGAGWDYGKKEQWETDLFLGFLSDKVSDNGTVTFTVKQTYIPWKLQFKEDWVFEPFTTGAFINRTFDEDLWITPPDKYPDKYYVLSTNLRFNIFVGQRITYNFKEKGFFKSIGMYYEFNTNDLYFISAVTNNTIEFADIIKFSFGAKVNF